MQRDASLAAFFYLAALVCYLEARAPGRTGVLCRSTQAGWYAGALACTLLGVFTKATVLTLPGAVVLLEVCFFPADWRCVWRRALPFVLVVALLPAALLYPTLNPSGGLDVKKMAAQADSVSRAVQSISRTEYCLAQSRVVVRYLRLLVFPYGQSIQHEVQRPVELGQPRTLAAIAILLAVLGAGFRLYPRSRLLAFSIFWFFLTLSIESSVFPLPDLMVEHRLYLPMVGFALFLPAAVFGAFLPVGSERPAASGRSAAAPGTSADVPHLSPADGMPPTVSVVIVTLDRGDLLRHCLASVLAQDYAAREIVVVDNGSTEDIRGLLQREFPAVRCLRLDRNCGFAGGNNVGIRAATGQCIALLNNDAVAEPGWLRAMVQVAATAPDIGAVGSVVIDGNRPGRLDSFGVGITLDGMSRQVGRGAPVPSLDGPREVLAVSGCACMFRADALRETGLFDERFFAYCEDTDLSLRLWRAGWRIAVAPEARVTHFYSQTSGAFSLRKVYLVERNHAWVATKNFPWLLLPLVPLTSIYRYLLQLYLVLRGAEELRGFLQEGGMGDTLRALVRAHASALAGMPAMLKQRRAFRPPRRVSDRDFRRLLLRHRLPMRDVVLGRSGADAWRRGQDSEQP